MLHIAICDDDTQNLNDVIELVNGYRAEQNRVLHYEAFQSPVSYTHLDVYKRQVVSIGKVLKKDEIIKILQK